MGTCVLLTVCGVGLFLSGCGGMRQTQVSGHCGESLSTVADATRIPVTIGEFEAYIDQPEIVRDSICRYLRDLASIEIARHEVFQLVEADIATSSLMSNFGFSGTHAVPDTVQPQHALDVDIFHLQERDGATVKIGIFSSQKKHAVAEVKVTLRGLAGSRSLSAFGKGKSSKGAWGIIAMVDRDDMKGGRGVWEMDSSMIGAACVNALRNAVEKLAEDQNSRAKPHGIDIEKRLLRPRTKHGI